MPRYPNWIARFAVWGSLSGIALSGLLTLPGCVDDMVDDSSVVEIDSEPPPPQVEVIPAAPYADAVWVGGRWVWRGRRHVWVGGRYVRGRPGYVYAPHAWERRGTRWRYSPGRWRHR